MQLDAARAIGDVICRARDPRVREVHEPYRQVFRIARRGKGQIPRADIDPAKSSLTPKTLDAVLGKTGDYTSGVYKITFGREAAMAG